MIVELSDTTVDQVLKEIGRLRESGGVVALGRVLSLIIATTADSVEEAIEAANQASREHPCRIVVLATGDQRKQTRLDAQIRVGGDAGASDVVVLYTSGQNAVESATLINGFLLPDAPIVVWWPGTAPTIPAESPLGRIAHRRIVDTSAPTGVDAPTALKLLREGYRAGDTDLSWTRLTMWRNQVAAIFDTIDPASVLAATVDGAENNAATILMGAWLQMQLQIPVTLASTGTGPGLRSVRLVRRGGDIVLARNEESPVAFLYQQDRKVQRISLPRRSRQECLTEELRRLDPDEFFGRVLAQGLPATNIKAVHPSAR
ncbi:glucose-6-phosphate dehydrogenase assembly protein OpcA [Auritidibacter ignavus]|uniref:glucose-6-phosphate dehydrogenase assembly protein OpcA n=1 Tax=Auritidibacter ignavus TaxID=678932 RepID=UPI002449E292|nr:glucose-6-phosphate dehydrogenase assembly protein OpcA [Auritidibacter ignavus]WGH84339.1 glucose-6-phosphate dehydrogenase assembly protein OpcA [Auritidibacter ignavus]